MKLLKLLWGRSKKEREGGTWVVGKKKKKKEREKKWYVGGGGKKTRKREGIYNGTKGDEEGKWKKKVFWELRK